MRDMLGNEVTTQHPATLAAVDAFTEHFLSATLGCGVVFEALRDDPDNVMANAYAASLILLGQRADAPDQVRPFLEAARRGAAAATAREQLYLDAVARWAGRDMTAASDRFEAIAMNHPRDVVAIAMGVIHHTALGEPERMLRLCDLGMRASADVSYLHGLRAFALDQCGRLDEAEAEAETAVAMNRVDPSAHHAMAHVLQSRNEPARGAAWMEAVADAWAACHSHMYTHNWWHTALFHIGVGDHARALAIFDQHVWNRARDYSQDQVNAIALLARLELKGLETGARWASVADHVEAHAGDPAHPLLDLHRLYALARAGRRSAETMLDGVAARAHDPAEARRDIWVHAMAPAAEALVAHARGDWRTAAARMERAMPHLQAVGGSHTQRELFADVLADARGRSAGH